MTMFRQSNPRPAPLHIAGVLAAMGITAVVAVLHGGPFPQTDPTRDQQIRVQFLIPDLPRSLDWTTKPWTGDDVPYKKIEAEIDAELGPKKSADAAKRAQDVVARRRAAALQSAKSLKDQTIVFAWAYAEAQTDIRDIGSASVDALRALAAIDPMDVYEYTRLRFLLMQYVYQNADHDDLKAVGERLLARRPDDLLVKVAHIYNLCSERSIGFAQAFTEAWARKEPMTDSPHLMLAYVYQYQMVFNTGHAYVDKSAPPNQAYLGYAQTYADKSIAEYQDYLKYAAPDAPSRKPAEYLIKGLKKIKASSLLHPSNPQGQPGNP